MKKIYLPKTEEVRYLEQNLTEAEIEQRIVESYDFELDGYSDISSSKVYGPMYRASAESSRERFAPLKIPCLEAGCSNTTSINWVHANCGGNFQISNRAKLKCNGCSLVEDLKNFTFKCSDHKEDYCRPTSQIGISALSEGAMDETITLELIQHLNNS